MTTLRLLRCAGRAAAFLACSFIAFAAADAQQTQLIDVGGHKLEMTRSGDGELHIMRQRAMLPPRSIPPNVPRWMGWSEFLARASLE